MARNERHCIILGGWEWEKIYRVQFIRLSLPVLAKYGRWKLNLEEKEQLDAMRGIYLLLLLLSRGDGESRNVYCLIGSCVVAACPSDDGRLEIR